LNVVNVQKCFFFSVSVCILHANVNEITPVKYCHSQRLGLKESATVQFYTWSHSKNLSLWTRLEWKYISSFSSQLMCWET